MRFGAAALLAALAIVPACAERIKIPNERPGTNSTLEGNIISVGDGGGGNGGVGGDVVIASRRSLRGPIKNSMKRGFALGKATNAQTSLRRREGQTSHYIMR
jgi:hypothetical protein